MRWVSLGLLIGWFSIGLLTYRCLLICLCGRFLLGLRIGWFSLDLCICRFFIGLLMFWFSLNLLIGRFIVGLCICRFSLGLLLWWAFPVFADRCVFRWFLPRWVFLCLAYVVVFVDRFVVLGSVYLMVFLSFLMWWFPLLCLSVCFPLFCLCDGCLWVC